jgi:hypothetical protein
MFSQFESVDNLSSNTISDIRPGVYREKIEEYENEDQSVRLTLRIFSLGDEKSPSVIDVIYLDEEDIVHTQDFIQLSNGAWRSGDGNINFDLSALFPINVHELSLTGTIDQGTSVIRISNEFEVTYA